MEGKFQDLFSGHANGYAQFRPRYPATLYPYLSTLTSEHEAAWDCATGSGQSAIELAKYYQHVIATDASEKQIQNATRHERIEYRVALADDSQIPSASLDLITVAQALHWFDLETFTSEVQRVLKPGGILAVWTYNLMQINSALDELVNHLYRDILGDYWSFERKLVEEGYQGIHFPMQEITPPAFTMQRPWQLSDMIGYLNTWSAVKSYEKERNINPVAHISDKLTVAWGTDDAYRTVNWPLTVKIWRS